MNRYSTLGSRFVAIIIDLVVVSPLALLSLYIIEPEPEWIRLLWIPIETVLYTGYFIVFHWKYGQTLGKMLTKVKVLDVSERPDPISFSQAFLRDIAYVVDGLLWISFTHGLFLYGIGPSSEEYAAATQYLVIPILIWGIVNLIVCLKNRKHRALHDLIAGTVVVRLDIPAEIESLNHTPPPPDHYKEVMS